MRGKVENFGNYNTLRLMLQKKDGDLSALIKEIQIDVLPKHLGIGILIGAPIWIGGTIAARKVSANIKKNKELRRKELEEKLENALASEAEKDKSESC